MPDNMLRAYLSYVTVMVLAFSLFGIIGGGYQLMKYPLPEWYWIGLIANGLYGVAIFLFTFLRFYK